MHREAGVQARQGLNPSPPAPRDGFNVIPSIPFILLPKRRSFLSDFRRRRGRAEAAGWQQSGVASGRNELRTLGP